MPQSSQEISLAEGAQRLGLSWNVTWRHLLQGKLAGHKNGSGRWVVTIESVEKLRRELAESGAVHA